MQNGKPNIDIDKYNFCVQLVKDQYISTLFEKKGKSFDELLDDLIKQTLINKEKSNEYISAFDSNILEKNTLKMKK